MEEQTRQAYLDAMGITSWVPKSGVISLSEDTPVVEQEIPVTPDKVVERYTEQVPVAVTPSKKHPAVEPSVISQPRSIETPEVITESSEVPWLDDAPPCLEELSPVAEFDEALESPFEQEDDLSNLGWEHLKQRVTQCERCELHKTRTQSVFGVGSQSADLLIIGEAPGAEEDRQGEPFVGRAGMLLNAMLAAIGQKREQVFIANILKCRPPGNRDPRPDEAARCQGYLKRQVALVQPKAIMAVGRIAAQNLLASQEPVGRLRGSMHQYDNIPVVVTYHPAYLLRSPDQKGKSWKDLQQALRLIS